MDGHTRIKWIVLMLPKMFKTGQVYQNNVWIDKITCTIHLFQIIQWKHINVAQNKKK